MSGRALYGTEVADSGVDRAIGASPSGKAADFDSAIRRFESSRPSQTGERRVVLNVRFMVSGATVGRQDFFGLFARNRVDIPYSDADICQIGWG